MGTHPVWNAQYQCKQNCLLFKSQRTWPTICHVNLFFLIWQNIIRNIWFLAHYMVQLYAQHVFRILSWIVMGWSLNTRHEKYAVHKSWPTEIFMTLSEGILQNTRWSNHYKFRSELIIGIFHTQGTSGEECMEVSVSFMPNQALLILHLKVQQAFALCLQSNSELVLLLHLEIMQSHCNIITIHNTINKTKIVPGS